VTAALCFCLAVYGLGSGTPPLLSTWASVSHLELELNCALSLQHGETYVTGSGRALRPALVLCELSSFLRVLFIPRGGVSPRLTYFSAGPAPFQNDSAFEIQILF
jgi:hypothetical protein